MLAKEIPWIMSATCPTCQKPLDAAGTCPACLMRLALHERLEEGDRPAAGPLSDLPSIEELNEWLTQFDVERLIGRGGMGGIYQARQRTLDRDVAIKVISSQICKDQLFIERFDREAKALAKLSHAGIVAIYDYGQTADGLAYLVMEFVDGINLRQAMQLRQIGPREAIDLTIQICRALEYAHSKGVVHRDIKPENILLGEDGTVKVADFGIAKLTDPDAHTPTLTATRQVLGSLHYLAPEHIETPSLIDHRVDLYAVGVVLYELLTGHLPIGRYEAPSAAVPALGRRIDDVVQQALSRRPQDRHASAEELRRALVELQADGAVPVDAASSTVGTPLRVAVPFSCESQNGFSESVGMAYMDGDSLTAEFRNRDTFLGSFFPGKTKNVTIARERLLKVRLTPGVFYSVLSIIPDSISQLGELPNAESGQVKLKIKNKDFADAQAGLRALGYSEQSNSNVFSIEESDDPFTQSQRITYGVLAFVCGALNLGWLAVAIIILANNFSQHVWFAASIVGVSTVIGVIACLQAVAGSVHWAGFSRGLANSNNIVSILPISPVWLISGPLAIWSWYLMLSEGTRASASPLVAASIGGPKRSQRSADASWGATTLMFLRESRWAYLLGYLNFFAGVALILGIAAYTFGLYPVELKYRLLDTEGSSNKVQGELEVGSAQEFASLPEAATSAEFRGAAEVSSENGFEYPAGVSGALVSAAGTDANAPIRRRLAGLNASASIFYDELTIRCWQRSAKSIHDSLSISGPVQVAWLANVVEDEPVSFQSLPTLLPVDTEPQLRGYNGLIRTTPVRNLQDVESAWVSEFKQEDVSRLTTTASLPGTTRRVVLKLSQLGRRWLLDHGQFEQRQGQNAPNENAPKENMASAELLLVADGMIVGRAELAAVRPDRITFDIAPDYEASLDAVYAALRGPNLKVELEPQQ